MLHASDGIEQGVLAEFEAILGQREQVFFPATESIREDNFISPDFFPSYENILFFIVMYFW